MKIPHRKRDYFIPVMFIIAIIASCICFFSHSSGTSTTLSKGLSLITTPLQSLTKSSYEFFASAEIYFQGINDLKEENDRLVILNKKLSEENAIVKELEAENEALYKFLDLKKEHTDYSFINGNVISKSTDGYTSVFTIDKGSFHGIEENMPIISPEGALVGITYSVEPASTRCRSIFSYDINVGVYDENSGETGILSGSFDTFSQNKCVIKGLSDNTTIKNGDKILTSGLGQIYPRGLAIGTVESFIPEQGSHTMSAVIVPEESAIVCDRIMVITSFERIYK